MIVSFKGNLNNQYKIDFDKKTIKRGCYKWFADIVFDKKYQLSDFIECLTNNDFKEV